MVNLTVDFSGGNSIYSTESFYVDGGMLSNMINNITKNIKMNKKSYQDITFYRRIADVDFERTKNTLSLMPGFTVSWHYNVDAVPQKRYAEEMSTKTFIR